MTDYGQLVDFVEVSMPKIRAVYQSYYRQGWNARLDNGSRYIHARSSHKGCYRQGWDAADEKLKAGIKIRRKKE